MAKKDNHKQKPWKANPDGDPNYPWYSYRNREGQIVYAIPLEAPNLLLADTDVGKDQEKFCWLPLYGKKGIQVYWVESTDREMAYEQKRWIEAEVKRKIRRSKVEVPIPEFFDGRSNDGNRKNQTSKGYDSIPTGAGAFTGAPVAAEEDRPSLGYEPFRYPPTEQMALMRVELELVQKYIEEQQPRSWRALYLKEFCGADVKEIAEELGVIPARVYQMIAAARKLALQFQKEEW